VSGSKSYNFEYDLNANVFNNGHFSFNYDQANLLLNVNNGKLANYRYDANKRRVKTTQAGNNTYQIYSQTGQFLHKFKLSNNQPVDYIFLGKQQIAKVEGYPGPQAPVSPSYINTPQGVSDGNYTLQWATSPGATSYQLQENRNTSGWVTVYTGNSLSKALSGKITADYRYRIKACSLNGCSQFRESALVSVNSPGVAVPTVPSGLSSPATDNNGVYTVSWNAVPNATSYELSRKYGNLPWGVAQNTGATSFAETAGGGTVYYRVRACNAVGCSWYSSTVQTTIINQGGNRWLF